MAENEPNAVALRGAGGEVCADVQSFTTGTARRAITLVWKDGVGSEPDRATALAVFRSFIADCRACEARWIETRVITEQVGLEPTLVAARAVWLQSILTALGYAQTARRVEYRLPLADAIARLEAMAARPRLTWVAVATQPGRELDRAARVLRSVLREGPGTPEYDDPAGYLLSRLDDPELVLPPESLQIGLLDGVEAAIVAPSVAPASGWCSLFDFGVVPEHRRRGLGTEAMLHGLRAMRAIGGRTYHDGADAGNAAMLALFAHWGAPRYRAIEQWTLAL